MGYTTAFEGQFNLDKPLTVAHKKILDDFADEDHRSNKGFPSIWCQWVPNENGTALEWDDGEKFYEYIPWIQYLLDTYLIPWGYKLNGEVSWAGEDSEDTGNITIENNTVEAINNSERMAELEEALNKILEKVPKQLQLFMGINKLLDKKLKAIFNAAASN